MRDQTGVFEDLAQQHGTGVAGEVFRAGVDQKLRLKDVVKSDTVSPMAWLWARCG